MNKKLPLPRLIFLVTVISMTTIFIINLFILNLSEYIEFFKRISEQFNQFVIVCEIILGIVLGISIGLLRFNGYQYTINIPLENTPSKFNKVYDEIYLKYNENLKLIKGNLATLEIFTWISYMLAFAAFPLGGIFIPSLSLPNAYWELWLYAVMFSCIGLPYLSLSLKNGKKKDYVEYFKDNCIKDFLKQFDFQFFRIAPFGTGDKLKEVFNEAGCDKKKALSVKVDDYIIKNIDDINIELVEGCFLNSFNGDPLQLFDGIFGYLKLNRNFNFRLRIKNVELYECDDLNKIELNESEFTKYFSVYSNDTNASERLSKDFMQLLIDMYKKYKIQFEININKDLIAIKFYTGKMFEPTIVGNSFDKNVFWAYYLSTNLAAELMNETKKYIDNYRL